MLKIDLLACEVGWVKMEVFHDKRSSGGDQVRPPTVELVS